MTVYNFGSINIDYVYRMPHFVQPGETLASESLETVLGGKGANQSVALARAGVSVKHLGRVSRSDQWAVDGMRDYGVDVSSIDTIDGASGHAIIQVDANGENAIVLHGGANQSFDESSLQSMLSGAQSGDWLLIQNECNALADAFAIAENKKMNIAFNPAPMNADVLSLPLERCQVLIVNELEALQLANPNSAGSLSEQDAESNSQLHEYLQQHYPDSMIVLTLGGKGALLLHDNKVTRVLAPSVEVVDSTGAGDTFVGYFLAGLIDQLEPQAALERACAAGALAVTVAGATPGIPDKAAVDRLTQGK